MAVGIGMTRICHRQIMKMGVDGSGVVGEDARSWPSDRDGWLPAGALVRDVACLPPSAAWLGVDQPDLAALVRPHAAAMEMGSCLTMAVATCPRRKLAIVACGGRCRHPEDGFGEASRLSIRARRPDAYSPGSHRYSPAWPSPLPRHGLPPFAARCRFPGAFCRHFGRSRSAVGRVTGKPIAGLRTMVGHQNWCSGGARALVHMRWSLHYRLTPEPKNLEVKRAWIRVVPRWMTERKVLSGTPLNIAVRVDWADVGGAEAWASYQSIGTQSEQYLSSDSEW
ncbi:hypothetical protein ACLOJK_029733 [Asimina triloba]